MRALFAADPDGFARFTASAAGIMADFSKEKLDAEALAALLALGIDPDRIKWCLDPRPPT